MDGHIKSIYRKKIGLNSQPIIAQKEVILNLPSSLAESWLPKKLSLKALG